MIMKKFLIIFISLVLTLSVQANEKHLKQFDKWLLKNKFTEFVKNGIKTGSLTAKLA